jgi:hypothetical protein
MINHFVIRDLRAAVRRCEFLSQPLIFNASHCCYLLPQGLTRHASGRVSMIVGGRTSVFQKRRVALSEHLSYPAYEWGARTELTVSSRISPDYASHVIE